MLLLYPARLPSWSAWAGGDEGRASGGGRANGSTRLSQAGIRDQLTVIYLGVRALLIGCVTC